MVRKRKPNVKLEEKEEPAEEEQEQESGKQIEVKQI